MKDISKLSREEVDFVTLVREAIDESGMTNAQLARELGLSSSTMISHFRYGLLGLALKHLEAFCKATNRDLKLMSVMWMRAYANDIYKNLKEEMTPSLIQRAEVEIDRVSTATPLAPPTKTRR